MGMGMNTQNITPHKPTLGWTIGLIVVAIVGYHFIVKKGK